MPPRGTKNHENEEFGLNGLKPMLLEDVGREFGVSRERIRQLQNSALAKMRKALMKKEQPMAGAIAVNLRARA